MKVYFCADKRSSVQQAVRSQELDASTYLVFKVAHWLNRKAFSLETFRGASESQAEGKHSVAGEQIGTNVDEKRTSQ